MKVIPNFTTRELLVENKIKGVINENLVDEVGFEISPFFEGYEITVVFADEVKNSIGAKLLIANHPNTTTIYYYSLPTDITKYKNVYYQVMATKQITNEVWKSKIEKLFFEESLTKVIPNL